MLTLVEVVNPQGTTLSLPLEDLGTGYLVKDIKGLDPVKATIASSSFAQLDGTQFQSSKRENRNIVLTLGYTSDLGGMSVRALRRALYPYFMPKSEVTLRFYEDDILFVEIKGRVEDMPAPLFVKEPSVDVSIICFDPDFIAPEATVFEGVSTVASGSATTLIYDGSIETGIEFIFEPIDPTSGFVLTNTSAWGTQRLNFIGFVNATERLTISTVPGRKSVVIRKQGVDEPYLYGQDPISDWIKLYPGHNDLVLATTTPGQPYHLNYFTRHGGL